ncbi:MAG: LOG family protein [Phycisphaerae bacterium]|nr:LOG family protein [Tepidisphaeraceae bacterium]
MSSKTHKNHPPHAGPAPTPTSDTFAENLEQTQESAQKPVVVPRQDLTRAHELASKLIGELEKVPDGDMVGEVIDTALKLLRDQTNRADIKLINKSLKELRYAMKVFAPYRETLKVSIFGSARTPDTHADYKAALAFGKRMANEGWMVITGAGGGIMAAGHGGAGADPSFGLAIRLPFEQKTNPFIADDKKLINFKYFFTRKLMFVRSSQAIALFPGGFGTMDEGFEVLTLVQTGKSVPMPIVFIDHPGGDFWKHWQKLVDKQLLERGLIGEEDLRLYKITDDVDEAAAELVKFYSNYHSVRYWKDDLIVRLRRKPTDEQLAVIQKRFKDIAPRGEFRVSGPLPAEKDEPSLNHLHRLVFPFNKRDHGKLRILIDHLNDLPE